MNQAEEVRRALRFNEQQAELYGRQLVASIEDAITDARRETFDAADLARTLEWAVQDARAAHRWAVRVQVGREALQEWDRVSA